MTHFLMPTIAYIDPGTGALLFALFMGIFGSARYFLRSTFIKLKFILTGGKVADNNADKLPIVIFSDDKRYWNVFGPICDELEHRHIRAEYWTMSEDDPAFKQDYKIVIPRYIGMGNNGFAKLNVMNAKICLSTTPGLDVYQWKRSKNVDQYIHIFHDVTDGMGYRMFGLDYYDSVLLTASFQEKYIRILESKRNINKKECVVCGSVYLDSMTDAANKMHQTKSSDITVLLAPSWGPSAILSRFGSEIIDSLLDSGFNVIIRPHPQSFKSERNIIEPLIEQYSDIDRLIWDNNISNIDSLSKADVLISDFSGIVTDFACVFDGPVIVADTNYDSSIYDASWIDEPSWMERVIDSIGIVLKQEDFPSIKDVILNLINDDKYSKGREKMRNGVWEEHGKAVDNVVNYLEATLKGA